MTRQGCEILANELREQDPDEIDWAKDISGVGAIILSYGARLLQKSRQTGEPEEVTPEEVARQMAATAVFAIVDLRPDGDDRPVHVCTLGDSSALILRDGRTWQSLKGGKSDGGAITTSRTAALPMVSREPPQPTSALLGRDDVLVLITDGVGDPLGGTHRPGRPVPGGQVVTAAAGPGVRGSGRLRPAQPRRRPHGGGGLAGPEPVMEEVVPVARLGRLGELLGAGGQGRVFDAPNLRLPDAPGSLVFKEYKSVPQSGYGLRKLVKIRNGLDPEARRKLDQRTAWPVRVVEDADRVCGSSCRGSGLVPPDADAARHGEDRRRHPRGAESADPTDSSPEGRDARSHAHRAAHDLP